MEYLILDKKQRVNTENENNIATTNIRLMEELDKKNIPYTLAYFDELEFEFINGETLIKAKGMDIRKYSHILLRGHDLHNEMQYHFKRYIVEYIDQHNLKNPESKIYIQNSKAIKKLPYYNKIAFALICSQNDIPYFNSYFRTDGNYSAHREVLNAFPLIMKDYSGLNRLEMVNGEEKVKKNVFKIDSEDGYRQEALKDLDHSRMFIQEFSDSGEDMRIFVKMGEVIAGWRRKSTDSFMTVSKGEYLPYNEPEEKIKAFAQNVARIFEADFIAVDIMMMRNKPLLQEISLHPGFTAYETKTGNNPVNIADAIITAFENN
ncbi:MAG: hypothetical protein UR61_C0005G0008 [candidate division WS6 bacterium GW2011_GWE1_34_7]|uniref:ATP-grasp domain-containing protein n=1 Tax=candidate division WS6 bacterium GW2011_GWE1_34_7 TaxID=1619093 RepID=A0A0G0DSY0_9BACT|nr:MAG: hypothetical protein UR61_C0005G0008 [candidate division WS6 bacterium GW2011_GWE1_34_7]